MTGRKTVHLRTAVAACVAVLALVGPSAALANGPSGKLSQGKPPAPAVNVPRPGSQQKAQGVVQAVTPAAVVVKQLDGSSVNVPVDRKTHVFVNNRPAQWPDVKPGFVLVASWKAGSPATTLRFVRPA